MVGPSPSPPGRAPAASARSVAVEQFAASLRELRAEAGTPSFRELAGRSRAISHTTLHEAAQGHRLPSWSTTVEFVRACGGDPVAYRERWERADETVRAAGRAGCAEVVVPVLDLPGSVAPVDDLPDVTSPAAPPADPAPPAAPSPDPTPTAPTRADDDVPPPRARRTRLLVAAGVAAVLVAAAITLAVVQTGDDDATIPSASGSPLAPGDCPIQQTNPPPVEPATPGDASAFIADITLPDCTEVRAGDTVVKTWRFKNTGTVPWSGYSLHRVDLPQTRDQCQTIEDIPLDDTAPGEMVDISTEITTPRRPGFCFVRFKLEDAAGRVAFPGSRPVNFQIVVG